MTDDKDGKKNAGKSRRFPYGMAGHFDLADSWDGWKVRGDWLISPDGDRINAQRLAGLLFVDSLSKRAAKARGKKSSLQEVVTAFRKKVAKAGEDPGS